MSDLKFKAVETSLISPITWGDRNSIKRTLESIWKNYSSYIKTASINSKIPASVITSFIAVESGGDLKAGGSGSKTQGLMQWNRNFAKEQLENELKRKRMTISEKNILAYYGIKFYDGKTRTITAKDQLKPELNILIGSIILGQLIDEKWATENNNLFLDRVIAVYNAGAFGEAGKKARQLSSPKYDTPLKLVNTLNLITSAYIRKMMGVNGAMDISTSDLKTLIL